MKFDEQSDGIMDYELLQNTMSVLVECEMTPLTSDYVSQFLGNIYIQL